METINEIFVAATQHFKEHPALLEPVEGDANRITTLTYTMLLERVQRFAGYLQDTQIEKGDRILIWSASRIDWMVAYLAILWVGGVIVPVDANSKEDFLTRIAQTTEAKYLITTKKQYEGLKTPPIPLINIDELPEGTFNGGTLPSVYGDDLAELVFTSGTTGQPKGVMLSHRNITSNAIAALQVVDIRSNDRALSILPLSHMFEATIDVAIIYKGASVLYARTLSPETLLKLLSTQHVTCMVLVPQALQLFLNGIEREVRRQKKERQFEMLQRVAPLLPFSLRRKVFGAIRKRFGGHFRFFVSGGAYLPPKLAERWENMGFRIIQGYGATECAPVVSVTPANDHNFASIGQPLPGEEVRIAEDSELLVRGPNVSPGYWKNPEATSAAFQDGWYHTGDLGYRDKKGNLYLKGRKKNLIVLANGLNVYPEDVENVLLTNSAIKDAVVIGLIEKNEGPSVHAILLMDDPAQVKAAIAQANKQLAPHQQIRGFTLWPEQDFPRTHTLKVKRPEVIDKLQTIRGK